MRVVALAPLLVLASCNKQDGTVSLPSEIVISKPTAAGQRFLTTNTAHLAFDTKTGSLCKTWNWGSDYQGEPTLSQLPIARQTTTCDRILQAERDEQRMVVAEGARASAGR